MFAKLVKLVSDLLPALYLLLDALIFKNVIVGLSRFVVIENTTKYY